MLVEATLDALDLDSAPQPTGDMNADIEAIAQFAADQDACLNRCHTKTVAHL
jgi:hypothetical protein